MGAVALPLVLVGVAAAAPPKKKEPATAPAAETAAQPSPSWIADELRILRADVDSLRKQPEAADLGALRAEVSRLAAAQAELERRLGGAPAAVVPVAAPDPGPGSGVGSALLFLTLGAALGWVGSRLSQRWRDRRLRIRV